MRKHDYCDFDLLFHKHGQGCRVQVLRSEDCAASASFDLPFEEAELYRLLGPLRNTRWEGGARSAGQGIFSPAEIRDIEALGEKLYAAVFSDRILACYSACSAQARRQSQGVRLRLRMDGAPDLARLPWEYLRDAVPRHFLTPPTAAAQQQAQPRSRAYKPRDERGGGRDSSNPDVVETNVDVASRLARPREADQRFARGRREV